MLLLAILLLSICGHLTEATLTIGSFNIQRLSASKLTDATVLNTIVTVIQRYDIAVILEVMDAASVNQILQALNRQGAHYSDSLSAATGRTSYKEHVAVIYRNDKVIFQGAYTYPDSSDAFEREPYTVKFHTTQASVHDFAVMGVHIKPDDAFREMNSLVSAYDDASRHFSTENILIAGDFNADCDYLSTTNYHNTNLWTDSRFTFLISIDVDTTASHNTNCAYDRFVAAGSQLRAAVMPGSALVYNIETGFHLTLTQTQAISDHYPIEVKLQ